jgi:AraC-like DNA-binding protein
VSFSEGIADKDLISKIGFSPRVWYGASKLCCDLFDHLVACYKAKSADNELKMRYLLNAALCEILAKSAKAKSDTLYISPTIGKAMSTVLADISADVTLTKLAASCGMTASYFSDLFHRETGKSFKKWLNSTRIEYAKRLLEEREMPIIEICFECGYNTPSQFIKMFKRETSMTPTEYRRRQRDKS